MIKLKEISKQNQHVNNGFAFVFFDKQEDVKDFKIFFKSLVKSNPQ